MWKRSVGLLSALTIVALVSSCTSDEGGTAIPTGDNSVTSESNQDPSTSATASAGAGDAPTATLQPCSLLDEADLAGYGSFQEPAEKDTGGSRACDWQTQPGANDSLVIGVNIWDDQGVADVNDAGNGVDRTQANGRDLARTVIGTRVCLLAIGVTESSRVDVQVTASDAQRACEVADEVAGKVEPKLPEG